MQSQIVTAEPLPSFCLQYAARARSSMFAVFIHFDFSNPIGSKKREDIVRAHGICITSQNTCALHNSVIFSHKTECIWIRLCWNAYVEMRWRHRNIDENGSHQNIHIYKNEYASYWNRHISFGSKRNWDDDICMSGRIGLTVSPVCHSGSILGTTVKCARHISKLILSAVRRCADANRLPLHKLSFLPLSVVDAAFPYNGEKRPTNWNRCDKIPIHTGRVKFLLSSSEMDTAATRRRNRTTFKSIYIYGKCFCFFIYFDFRHRRRCRLSLPMHNIRCWKNEIHITSHFQ